MEPNFIECELVYINALGDYIPQIGWYSNTESLTKELLEIPIYDAGIIETNENVNIVCKKIP